MEIALAEHFNSRANLIVPNVSWGMEIHECDLLILTPQSYAWEIELKVDKYDLIKDKEKKHNHNSYKIKYLYFAITNDLLDCKEHIPERAGIIQVYRYVDKWGDLEIACKRIRKAKVNSQYKFSAKERQRLTMLGAMRIWTLKKRIIRLENKIKGI